jgi:dolichol-phosphate mannosyltransferase
MECKPEMNVCCGAPLLSIVIPVMNEAESIPFLASEVESAMSSGDVDWECLWVDDGSTDETGSVLAGLESSNPRHRALPLAHNFGQSAALAVGFSVARGKVLGTLDGDGQNDPADLLRLLEHMHKSSADMVNGIRAKRKDSIVRKLSSQIANRFRNSLTGESVTDVGCAIRVFKRECVEKIPVFKGMHRFFPTLVKMQGFSITEIPVNHRPRERGKTKYGINNRLWVGLADTFAVMWMKRRLVWPKLKSWE